MTHHELRATLKAIAAGDVGAIGPIKAERWNDGFRWYVSSAELDAEGNADTLQDALVEMLVAGFASIAARIWRERWEPLIRTGVALMCSVGAAKVAEALGVSVEDVRGIE